MDNAAEVGAWFRSGLEGLKEKHEAIGDVRGMGLMQAIELVKDRGTKEHDPEMASRLMDRARENGLLVGKGGIAGNVIRMSPPLNIAKSDVDEAIRIMDEALSAVRQPAVAAAR